MAPGLHAFLFRLKSLLNKRRLDRDLADELAFHHAMLRDKQLREGAAPPEAEATARAQFGSIPRWHERLNELWQFPLLENLARDVSFSARLLRRSPGFTSVALLTLALSIGAATSVFSLLNGLLLRPLPVPHAEQLVLVCATDRHAEQPFSSFSMPVFRALETRVQPFQNTAAFFGTLLQVRNGSGNVEVPGVMVSGEYFQLLGVEPLIGRYLTPQNDRHPSDPDSLVVVLSEHFWRTWFHADPNVVGRTLTISNSTFTVIGVMPKRFIGADPTSNPEMYLSLSAEPILNAPYNNTAGGYHNSWLRIIARRNPSVSLLTANAALQAGMHSLLVQAVPEPEWVTGQEKDRYALIAEQGSNGYSYLRRLFKRPLVVVFALCCAMLLLASINLASLLMARAAARERELATRLAIGATRRRLVSQLLVESLLIATLGTALGLALSPVVSHLLASLLVGDSHSVIDTSLDIRVFAFSALVAFASAIAIGLLPALRVTSGSLSEQIKDGSHATSLREKHQWLPRALMSIEVALALLLVFGAALLATSLTRLYHTGLGFQPNGLVNLNIRTDKQPLTGDALLRWYHDFGEALTHLPGVESTSFQSITPLTGSSITNGFYSNSSNGSHDIFMNGIAPDYFRTMRIPMLAGRDFRWDDDSKSGLKIILNQKAAQLLFPGQNPIGRQVYGWKNAAYEVIAVVGDVHYESIRRDPPAGAYTAITQDDSAKPSYTAVVRSHGPAAPLAAAVRDLAARMAPEIPAPAMSTMNADLDASISAERMMAMLAVFFAACALFVTAIGLYGTLAYATARRTSEIGIRMALGAQRTQVVALVFRANAWVAIAGCLAGLVAALAAARALTSFLYGTSVRDPWIMLASVAALALVASAASLIPAIRAARIDPMQAIRCE